MPHLLLSIFYLVISLSLWGQNTNERVLQVQNPRPLGGWVSDGIGYLTDSGAISEINDIASKLEKETTAEIAIVTIPSIGEESPKAFATTLFETWGIGKKGKDNGILVLHVLDQRRVEIETGYGQEGILPDILCKRILESFIIPNFKLGNFSVGMTKGTYAIAHAIRYPSLSMDEKLDLNKVNFEFADLPISHYQSLYSTTENTIPESPPGIFTRHIKEPIASFKEYFYFWLGLIIVSIWFLIGSILARLPYGNETFYNIHAYLGRSVSWLAGIFSFGYMVGTEFSESETFFSLLNLLPISFVLFYVNKWIGKSLRNNPRQCPTCKMKMVKLNEKEDDAHLSAGEISEEKIFSVDYDIWQCKSCNTIHKERYTGDSPASQCKKCNFYTYRNISVRVVRTATYDHGGEEIHNYECAHCKLFEAKRITTAKLQRPSSSRSSSSSGGSWSSGGSGGSWGGGSSGGGGAGSSY